MMVTRTNGPWKDARRTLVGEMDFFPERGRPQKRGSRMTRPRHAAASRQERFPAGPS